MKPRFHPHRRSQAAITRLEIVVLVGIFTVLAALICPSSKGPRESARKGKAGTVVKNIVNACKAYANEYGQFPIIPPAKDGSFGSPPNTYLSFGDTAEGGCKVENSQLFNVLRAIADGPNTGDMLNPRKTRYFEEGKANDKKHPREGFTDGPDFPTSLRGRLFDPWGTEYCIVLDTDGDEKINLGAFYSDLASKNGTVPQPAVAFSLAKDGKRGGKNYPGMFRRPNSDEASDDVASW